MAILATSSPAQERTNYIFHAYVDPIYGDNALASAQNPGAVRQLLPLDQHADPGNPPLVPKPIQGRLNHAPYSFLTLTGPNGALAYVNTAFPGGLPWQRTIGGIPYSVEKVVFHCMPGLYGPQLAGQPIVDPRCGLPWNGEAFPAVIPHGVSIRGTSALDVIFDARRQVVNVFEAVAQRNQLRHEFDIIDRVTIRGAVGYQDDVPVQVPNLGAGVYVRGPGRSFLTVSNCFITGNTVGIATDAESPSNEPPAFGHHIRVINNTIAWNTLGVWNGNTLWLPSVGIGDSQFLNNIFDTKSPSLPGYEPGWSAFEGMREAQMFVIRRLVPPSGPHILVGLNMNAWPIGRGNLGLGVVNWLPTVPSGPPAGTAVYDLAPFLAANSLTAPRTAILYVNDALRAGLATDYSPHDFRLSPRAWDANAQPLLNPMVNLGIENVGLPFGSNIEMGVGQPIPGALGPSTGGDWIDVPATIHCWDWDADGFGNPRIAARAGFLPGQFSNIDLGADEMGELIMAGYIDRTRIYSHQVINAPSIPDHTRVFFFDLPTATYPRPIFNLFVGGLELVGGTPTIYYPWWSHAQTPMNAVAGTNYTAGNAVPQSSRNALIVGQGRLPFMRNLMCDVSPHLAQDWHPIWADAWDLWPSLTPPYHDVYACHPWFDGLRVGGASQGQVDNPFLFHNPSSLGATSANDWGIGYHQVDVGIATPAGSYPSGGGSYLLFGPGTAVFGPWGPCQSGGPTTTYRIDPALNPLGILGIGDNLAGCPDILPWFPALATLGLRMNCQRQTGTLSNLQSFLVITTNTVDSEMEARSGPRTRGEESFARQAGIRSTAALEELRQRSQRR